jgi:16S rRNA (uracil1498-N3)-methyltransferase
MRYLRRMPVHDFTSQRLFLEAPLSAGARIFCSHEQANYLLNVLRLQPGSEILVFNGRDGEWRARVEVEGKRGASLTIAVRVREQTGGPDIHFLFAPLKRARLDYLVEKATEMGVARICPVLTRRTVPERINLERMRANVIEAAEQCGVLRVPEVADPVKLERVLQSWQASRRLIFCDEATEVSDPILSLRRALSGRSCEAPPRNLPLAVLIGPEGGFDPEEREIVLRMPFTVSVSLGPRIMRADTAAVAALALVNAVAGDWA